tara:strand:- start:181 stop:936 length:756 start_codon:yes stop_codon:yes gene_type:complete
MITSESGHWYTIDGKPKYTIVGKNGKERNTTLRDARKLNLVPSVTTILDVAAKPGLVNWQVNQGIQAALTLPRKVDETDEEFLHRVRQDSKEQAEKAAEQGTNIHADINMGFAGKKDSEVYTHLRELLDKSFPNQEWVSEQSYTSKEKGYGGAIDLHSKSIVVDFKTKDNIEGKDASKLVFDNHGMQLSAYAELLYIGKPTRVSIFIDRKNPSVILPYVWDMESHLKHLVMFNSLLTYWKMSKNYDPTETL